MSPGGCKVNGPTAAYRVLVSRAVESALGTQDGVALVSPRASAHIPAHQVGREMGPVAP